METPFCEMNENKVKELIKFAHFVAKEVVLEGDRWESNYMSFPELACRRLYKLGIIEKDGSRWYYEEPEEE